MTDTTTPEELQVTLAPLDALQKAGGSPTADNVRVIARPVVAAELRRLAEHYSREAERCEEHSSSDHYDGSDQYVWGEGSGYSTVADALRARADELDPQP